MVVMMVLVKMLMMVVFAWNPHSLGISPQEAHLEDEMLMVMIRLEICQKIYTTEDFRVKNLHRKRVIFDIC